MKRLHYALVGLMVLLLSGCGQTVIETLKVPQVSSPNATGQGKTIVILPFADYSNADSLAAVHRRDMAITEALTDRLVANGFNLPIQEDVFDYMVDQSIISLVDYEQNTSLTLKNELSGEWSEVMKDQLRGYISEHQVQNSNQSLGTPGTHGLTDQTVAKIGRKFQADYIVRGRILEFKTRQEHTWEPWKRGILPFIFGTNDQLFLGFARTDQYDFWNDMRADGFLGLLGYSIDEQEYSSGQLDQAVVQIRIWVQEAATGNIIWTNRVDVKSSPKSMWADKQHDALFEQSIETGVSTLVDNFITTGL